MTRYVNVAHLWRRNPRGVRPSVPVHDFDPAGVRTGNLMCVTLGDNGYAISSFRDEISSTAHQVNKIAAARK